MHNFRNDLIPKCPEFHQKSEKDNMGNQCVFEAAVFLPGRVIDQLGK